MGCCSEAFKIFPDVCEGLLGFFGIPLGSVFLKQIVVVPVLPQLLKVLLVNVLPPKEIQAWTKVALYAAEKHKSF